MTALTPVLSVPGTITPVKLQLPARMAFKDWEALCGRLQNVEQSIMFWLGDLILYGDEHYGEKHVQAFEGYSPGTISNATYVCRQIPPERRREELRYGHHTVVAGLEEKTRDEWLDKAVENNWSVNDLRKAKKLAEKPPEEAPEPDDDKANPKDPRIKDSKLLQAAKDHDCIRCGSPDPVAAHYSGLEAHKLGKGTGTKCHDIATAFLCDPCHKYFDSYADGNDYERCFDFLLLIILTIVDRMEAGELIVD